MVIELLLKIQAPDVTCLTYNVVAVSDEGDMELPRVAPGIGFRLVVLVESSH